MPRRPARAILPLLAAAIALVGCSGTAEEPGPAAPAGPRLDAAGITALAARRPPTALPPASQTTAQAQAALAETGEIAAVRG